MSTRYDDACEFCGDPVGPPDPRAFFAVMNTTYFPGGETQGIRIRRDPDDQAMAVHEVCWLSFWSGTEAGVTAYPADDEDGE